MISRFVQISLLVIGLVWSSLGHTQTQNASIQLREKQLRFMFYQQGLANYQNRLRRQYGNHPAVMEAAKPKDFDLIKLVAGRRGSPFVEAHNVVVTQLLPDDVIGLPHQKWMVQLSDGNQVMAVSNLKLCPRIPLKPGDVISLAGEFIFKKEGGIIHWLHSDPQRRRPNGYVQLNGTVYCQ